MCRARLLRSQSLSTVNTNYSLDGSMKLNGEDCLIFFLNILKKHSKNVFQIFHVDSKVCSGQLLRVNNHVPAHTSTLRDT